MKVKIYGVVCNVILVLVLQTLVASAAYANDSLPGRLAFLLGEWEATIPSNRYRMRVKWDEGSREFHGILTRNGLDSADVGFEVGEHIWTAKVLGKPAIVVAVQKYRGGRGGISTSVDWLLGSLDLERSSENSLVHSHPDDLSRSGRRFRFTRVQP